MCVNVEERVHVEHSAARLERHLGRGVPQHSGGPGQQRHHAPAQSETAPGRACAREEKCRGPPKHHR